MEYIQREITPIGEEDLFIVLNHPHAKFDYAAHFHSDYEINMVINGKGKRIVGDCVDGLVRAIMTKHTSSPFSFIRKPWSIQLLIRRFSILLNNCSLTHLTESNFLRKHHLHWKIRYWIYPTGKELILPLSFSKYYIICLYLKTKNYCWQPTTREISPSENRKAEESIKWSPIFRNIFRKRYH